MGEIERLVSFAGKLARIRQHVEDPFKPRRPRGLQ
jgi:hypothetical protein